MRLGLIILWGVVAASPVGAATIEQDFSGDPAAAGWAGFGNTNLFYWNPTNQNLEVTWDSTSTNSYFYRPLGMTLTTNDAFTLDFDLRLNDVVAGGFGFELAIGFFRLADATNAGFLRGTGHNSPNIFEFDYFPDVGFDPSIDATLIDANSRFRFVYDNLPLDTGIVYHVKLIHPANSWSILGEVLAAGQPYSSLPVSYVQPPATNFAGFRLDAISISSYDDTGSAGSILAHGVVDNLVVSLPPPPIQNLTGAFSNDVWHAQFLSSSNWLYTLERTADFQSWTNVGGPTPGNGAGLVLPDTNSPMNKAFYRVRAYRP